VTGLLVFGSRVCGELTASEFCGSCDLVARFQVRKMNLKSGYVGGDGYCQNLRNVNR
jgi:hypothetical protein